MQTEIVPINPLAGYAIETEMARIRKVTQRTLRAERQRGEGPPYVRDGKRVYYSLEGFREWLKSRERQPVRSGR
jgi:hypothetical protein